MKVETLRIGVAILSLTLASAVSAADEGVF